MALSPLVESTRKAKFQLRRPLPTRSTLLVEHWARDKIGRFASHEHPGSETGWGPSAGGKGTVATPAEIAGARRAALEKYRKAKPPSAAAAAEWQRRRAAGESADDIEKTQRGGSPARRARKNKMGQEFGNGHDVLRQPDGQEPSGQFDEKGKSITKQTIYDRDSSQVVVDPYCGTKIGYSDVQADRIYPGSKGGAYTYDNVIPCCGSCNKTRSDTDFLVFFNKQSKARSK